VEATGAQLAQEGRSPALVSDSAISTVISSRRRLVDREGTISAFEWTGPRSLTFRCLASGQRWGTRPPAAESGTLDLLVARDAEDLVLRHVDGGFGDQMGRLVSVTARVSGADLPGNLGLH